jgi:hypothetical protein
MSEAMNKTLSIELSDQRKAIAKSLYAAMYRGALKSEHEINCAWTLNAEDNCDCNLSVALDVVRGEV